jgi:hypothetical protein
MTAQARRAPDAPRKALALGRSRLLQIGVAIAVVAGCASAPQYDQTTDAAIGNLQKEVDSQLVQWISDQRENTDASKKDASYAQNEKFYDKVDTDLTSLELRMEAVPDASSSKLTKFFDALYQQINNVRDVHQKQGNLSAVAITATRNQLNTQFAVLITYELSLKGVSSPTKSSTESTATTTAANKAAAVQAN